MPVLERWRPLKRWCYVGIFAEDAMLCAASAAVGPLRQRFWAIWDRLSGTLDTETLLVRTRRISVSPSSVTIHSGGARLELALTRAGQPVEVVSPHGRSYIWTRKTPVRADGHFTLGLEVRTVSAYGLLDESAGYHARRTDWEWSCGIGTSLDGWPVTWNLVRGVHDAGTASERTVWVGQRAREVAPVRFSPGLEEVVCDDGSILSFKGEATRARREQAGVISSEYACTFGCFGGTLPGGVELSVSDPAFGVMERHRARW